MTDKHYEYNLFWHALNYRTAMASEANDFWKELVACHERILARELAAKKEDYAKVCDRSKERVRDGADVEWQDGYNAACEELAVAIRALNEREG